MEELELGTLSLWFHLFVCLFVRLFQLHDGTKDESAKIVDAVQLRWFVILIILM